MAERVSDETILRELVELSARHKGHLLAFQSLVGAHQYRRLYRLFREHVPAGAHVLDWGAGNGHFSYFLLRSGYQATGYSFWDFTYQRWLPDSSYHFVPGIVDDPVTLPFDNGAFDAVASIGVLEHVRETGGHEEGSLREMVRVLKPGGIFVCYHFPNRYSFVEFMARAFPRKHSHASRYNANEIRSLVLKSGMELVRLQRYGFLPRNSWKFAPDFVRNAKMTADFWDAFDGVLGTLASSLCQNYLFVARKPTPS